MILNILKVSDEEAVSILRARSQPVVKFDMDLKHMTENMKETMYAANGAGLAAPQIGVNQNIFVFRTERSLEKKIEKSIVVINPQIQVGGSVILDYEGCLSIPGFFGQVSRWKDVVITYQDIEGEIRQESFTNWDARVIQHEYDHLVGVLYPDKAKAMYAHSEEQVELDNEH